ncbi:squalene-hopene/tetraprenyl-beta-curcumene cyclase [Crossiella equi]|uniref:Squalene-hopene/tetraprenyl-beta-curcumene cyclase n=1 Tax=Crossiella equi TaxID=130796 RepID=A0ABS5AQP8_9PSEU|nr:prenyltransferase/squalene oxidase repeat-containing protein [Crossiella equi]MBP2478539.1 squalene-hopene/tetraprenyl-beta-curcumene cyclase [Crossiella equi]
MAADPSQLTPVLDSAVAHALAQQRADGSWCGLPAPRVLDTAVTALALAADPDDGGSVRALAAARAWLARARPQTHHPVAQALETTVRAFALGTAAPVVVDIGDSTDTALAGRIRLLAVLARYVSRLPAHGLRRSVRAELDRREQSPWTVVELLASLVVLGVRAGERTDAADWAARLRGHQWPDGSFHGNPVSTALAFLALCLTGTEPALLASTRAYLLSTQQPDGTWRYRRGEVWDTALLVRAGRGLPAFDRQALPRALDFLAGAQNPDGGWALTRGLPSDNRTTASVLLALAGYDRPGQARALAHLADQRTEDGLWRTWQDRRDPPVPDVVAEVVTALDRHRDRHEVPLGPARAWLAASWRESPGWENTWRRNAPLAVAALGAAVPGTPAAEEAVRWLLAAQAPDGGWGPAPGTEGSPAATAAALLALASAPPAIGPAREAAVRWLLERRHDNGTWPGEPDTAGPRPVLVHHPLHTHALVLAGLRAAQPS